MLLTGCFTCSFLLVLLLRLAGRSLHTIIIIIYPIQSSNQHLLFLLYGRMRQHQPTVRAGGRACGFLFTFLQSIIKGGPGLGCLSVCSVCRRFFSMHRIPYRGRILFFLLAHWARAGLGLGSGWAGSSCSSHYNTHTSHSLAPSNLTF
jgi:hypothetical protein